MTVKVMEPVASTLLTDAILEMMMMTIEYHGRYK